MQATTTDSARLEALRLENAELRARCEEAEDTLTAIRRGDVDAFVVGEDVYVLARASAVTQKLHKDVLAQMEDAVLAFDAHDHVIFMNAAAERQYRKSASEVLGHSKAALYEECWPETALEASSQQELHSHGFYRAHTIHIRTDCSVAHVEATVSRLRNADGAAVGTLSVIRDISLRARAARRV